MKIYITLLLALVFTAIMPHSALSAYTITEDQLNIGKPGSSANKTIKMSPTGAGVRYNVGASQAEVSHDGSTWTKINNPSSAGTSSGSVNMLSVADNADFELGTSGWTSSGGSFTIETTNPLFGAKSAIWDPSALNQTLTSALKPIPVGLQNHFCMAMMSYKYGGADGDVKFQVTDGTSLISGAEVNLLASSDAALAYVYFTCPASGSLNARLIAAVSNPSAVTWDGAEQSAGLVYLGSGSMLSMAEPPGFWGQINYPGGPANTCVFSQTTPNGSYTGFPAETTCPVATAFGRATAPATKIPAITMPNARKGRYRFTIAMATNVGASSSFFRLSDGTTISESSGMVSSSTYGNPMLVLYMFFPTDGTRTVELQAGTYTGTALVNVDARYAGLEQFTMTAEYIGPY